jgi:AraC-like DNA-binding protein
LPGKEKTTMSLTKRRDGFQGEKQINIPKSVLNKFVRKTTFLHSLYVTHIGYFPKASFHYRERKKGCDDYILLYSLGGKGYIENNAGKMELSANQFIIIPPHLFHRYQADLNNPWTLYWVHFSSDKLKEFNTDFKAERFYTPTDLRFNQKIIDVWIQMFASLAEGYSMINISYANLCLYRFLSFFLFPNKKFALEEEDDRLDQSISFMKENIGNRLTADDLANRFQYSSSHYTAIFKQKTGMSPIDYFIRMKIQFACQLLTQTGLKIKEVADRVGYDDPYYFSRLFKQLMGQSPKEYKKID